MRATITRYYGLTKPGIIYGNALTAAAGFFLASRGHPNFFLLIALLLGLSLIVASGCVFNNYIDRDIDEKMERTKERALVKKLISSRSALIFAFALGLFGTLILFTRVNALTTLVAILGLFIYVFVYSIFMKRRSMYAAHVGSVAGAVPPLAGYCAVTGRIDTGAILLFLMLCFWQMPHFFAIALYRSEEYAAAGIPTLPRRRGPNRTNWHMLFYILLFTAATLALTPLGYTGFIYFFVASLLCGGWILLSIRGFQLKQSKGWARHMFFFSLILVTILSLMLSLDSLLR